MFSLFWFPPCFPCTQPLFHFLIMFFRVYPFIIHDAAVVRRCYRHSRRENTFFSLVPNLFLYFFCVSLIDFLTAEVLQRRLSLFPIYLFVLSTAMHSRIRLFTELFFFFLVLFFLSSFPGFFPLLMLADGSNTSPVVLCP